MRACKYVSLCCIHVLGSSRCVDLGIELCQRPRELLSRIIRGYFEGCFLGEKGFVFTIESAVPINVTFTIGPRWL